MLHLVYVSGFIWTMVLGLALLTSKPGSKKFKGEMDFYLEFCKIFIIHVRLNK